jgi:hypothetical protein
MTKKPKCAWCLCVIKAGDETAAWSNADGVTAILHLACDAERGDMESRITAKDAQATKNVAEAEDCSPFLSPRRVSAS